MPDPKGRRFSVALYRLRIQTGGRLALKVTGQFRSQSAAISRALRAGTNPLDEFVDADEKMLKAMGPQYRQAARGTGKLSTQIYGYTAQPIPADVVAAAGRRIVSINGTTRDMVQRRLRYAVKENLSTRETQALLREVVVNKKRVRLIARTELGFATNQSMAQVMRGEAETHVETLDGPDCGWTSHSDPRSASGLIVTIDAAEEVPLAHPNCVRAFTPVARSSEAELQCLLTSQSESLAEKLFRTASRNGSSYSPESWPDLS